MFCIKCGTENPDAGKFCRSCGERIGAPTAIAPTENQGVRYVKRLGRPVSLESAIAQIFTGLAFIIVACILGYTGAAGARVWWFWMLIPGFGSLGRGVARYFQARSDASTRTAAMAPEDHDHSISAGAAPNLPPAQQQWASTESRYKTGDLVPPSVTDSTTRHLELDKEGQTMTLPSDRK